MILLDLSPIANHLWQSTCFAEVAGLLTLAMRKNRAAVRYWLWLSASVKFLIPFSWFVSIGSQFDWKTAPAMAQPQFAAVVNEISRPFAIPTETFYSPEVLQPTASPLPTILLGIWLAGVILGLIFWMRLRQRTNAIRRDATQLHLSLPIPVLQAAAPIHMEPGVFGIFRPAVILPAGVAENLTPAQLGAVLAHELHHVRRKDNLTGVIHMLVEIVFWFHPLVWWIRHRLLEERERACDEAVATELRDPQIYVEAILKVCKLYVGSQLLCVSGVTGSDLKRRIEAIMKNQIALRLNFARKAVLTAGAAASVAIPLIVGIIKAPTARAQSKDPQTQEAAQAKIVFEVASIRPAATPGRGPVICLVPCSPGERLTVKGTRVDIRYMPISELVMRAYRVKPYQVSGPDWIRKQRFDITAKLPEGAPADRLPEMLQSLLADRFKLTIHRETKDMPVYALVVGKNGIKLEPSAPDADVQPPAGPKAVQMFTPEGEAHMENGRITITGGQFGTIRSAPGGKWELLRLTMPALAEFLTPQEDHPVIDKTNLSGAYRLAYEIRVGEGGRAGRGDSSPSGPPAESRVLDSLLEAVERGGLKLERRNAPIETIMIDHVEKIPTAN